MGTFLLSGLNFFSMTQTLLPQTTIVKSDTSNKSSQCFRSGDEPCPWNKIRAILFTILVFGAVVCCTSLGYTAELVVLLSNLGFYGYIIFVLLLTLTALPCGYGYTIMITGCGAAYGWYGLIPSIIGTITGLCVSYFASTVCLRKWVKEFLDNKKTNVKIRKIFLEIEGSVDSSWHGFLLLCLAHTTPLTYGWINAFKSSIGVKFLLYLCSGMLGESPNIIFYAMLGRSLANITSMLNKDEDKSTQQSRESFIFLIVQLSASIIFIIFGGIGSAIIIRRVLKENSTPELALSSISPIINQGEGDIKSFVEIEDNNNDVSENRWTNFKEEEIGHSQEVI